MNKVNSHQLSLPFGYDTDRNNRLYRRLQSDPLASALVRDHLNLSKEDAEKSERVRLDEAFTEKWSEMATTRAVIALGIGTALGLAILSGAAPLGLVTITGAFINCAAGVTHIPGPDNYKSEYLAKEVRNDQALMEILKARPQKILTEDREVEKQTKGQNSRRPSLLDKALGGLNVIRTLPQWLALPLVNAVLPPEKASQEHRNQMIGTVATGALVAVGAALTGVGALLAVPAAMALGVTATAINTGRKTEQAVSEMGVEGLGAKIKIGYKEAIGRVYEGGTSLISDAQS